jgi:cytochrome c2
MIFSAKARLFGKHPDSGGIKNFERCAICHDIASVLTAVGPVCE